MYDVSAMKLGLRPPRLGLHAPGMDRLGVELPIAAPSIDWGRAVAPGAWGMDCNDQWGDCTIAGAHHAQVAFRANSGGLVRDMSEAEALANYRAVNPGFDPSDPSTDQGAMLSDVVQYWCGTGFLMGGKLDRAAAFVRAAPGDDNELRLAVQWFGCALVGLAMPLSAQQQEVWDVAGGEASERGLWGGHCVLLTGYDPAGLTCITWGAPKRLTWRFWREYASEAWAVLSADWIEHSGASPAGIALDTLRADVAEMAA
jgi:hypothetical protein